MCFFAGLLNAVDGVAAQEGRLLFSAPLEPSNISLDSNHVSTNQSVVSIPW